MISSLCMNMIFSENRFPPFRIVLYPVIQEVDGRGACRYPDFVEVLRVPLDPELRGKPVQCRRCPRNCKR
jgi:hypothetical protein